MIKKILLGLFVCSFSFLGFGYAFPDLVQVVPGSNYSGNVSLVEDFYLKKDLSFGVPVKYSNFDGEYQSAFYWDEDGYLHYFVLNQYGRSDYVIDSYNLVVSGSSDITLNQSEFINYVSNNLSDVWKVEFYFGYTCQSAYNYGTTFSIHFNNGDYIYFAGGLCEGNNLYVNPGGGPKQSPTTGTLAGLRTYDSPFKLGVDLGSEYSAIRYYENTYGWDESICYVGVDSLEYLYGQNGVSFNEGAGLSIFEVYSGLYLGDNTLSNIYVWLNSWLFNYENWFGVSSSPSVSGVGNPSWLSHYNSGTNQVDIYYDNLTFPFAGHPVAIYFMSENIENHSVRDTMGSTVISYCNLKINNGSFDDIIDDSDKNNIIGYTEKTNVNQGLNPDGSSKDYGTWSGDLAFSGNTSIKNTLKNFFDEFDKSLGALDVNTSNRILPTWIVSAFIFVVLFKFLRKR